MTNADEALAAFPIPLIGFAAYSGTGKTTLLVRLLPLLKARGLRVGVVKHAHHDFEMDLPGKDSYELRAAGADEMLVAARCRFGLIRECRDADREPRLHEALEFMQPRQLDLVLVEGFKREPIPKIELHRVELGLPFLFPRDPNVVAIACDASSDLVPASGIPRLAIDRVEDIAQFILEYTGLAQRPNINLAQ
ncbi:MAG: molybdopterin-guanine dinucleotide biosynthesis protein B [Gammaproteobacteria bacterium]|nr:molybdopterin-guanine dinucleotide biosynthesis protein B [Gammaproteobacteria bacterium]MCB1925767.1 molybdopterin-guanine dinucleotide biosynthesis protein B [Gammaproteobacteria bacterium]